MLCFQLQMFSVAHFLVWLDKKKNVLLIRPECIARMSFPGWNRFILRNKFFNDKLDLVQNIEVVTNKRNRASHTITGIFCAIVDKFSPVLGGDWSGKCLHWVLINQTTSLSFFWVNNRRGVVELTIVSRKRGLQWKVYSSGYFYNWT